MASELLIVNPLCSALCNHCPYGGSDTEDPDPIHQLIKKIEQSEASLFILSGGEPLENPDVFELLSFLEENKKPFRIATGGHVPLVDYAIFLLNSSSFMGFSVGTDIVIPSRNSNENLRKIWASNISVLNDWEIPYSITITYSSDIGIRSLLALLKAHQSKPKFIMLSELEGLPMNAALHLAIKETIAAEFTSIEIVDGFKN